MVPGWVFTPGESAQEQIRVEEAAYTAAIRCHAARGDRIRFFRCALRSARPRTLSLCGLRQHALRFECEIRFRDGLAELLGSHRCRECAREKRFQRGGIANRSEMRALRRAFWARFHGRAGADGLAVLHEFRGAALCPSKKLGCEKYLSRNGCCSSRGRMSMRSALPSVPTNNLR